MGTNDDLAGSCSGHDQGHSNLVVPDCLRCTRGIWPSNTCKGESKNVVRFAAIDTLSKT